MEEEEKPQFDKNENRANPPSKQMESLQEDVPPSAEEGEHQILDQQPKEATSHAVKQLSIHKSTGDS